MKKYVYALFDSDHPLANKYFDDHCFALVAHYKPWQEDKIIDVHIGEEGASKIEDIFETDDQVYPDWDLISVAGCVPAYDYESDWNNLVEALGNDEDFIQDPSLLDAYFEQLPTSPSLHPQIVWSVIDIDGDRDGDISLGYLYDWQNENRQSDGWRLLDEEWIDSCISKAVGDTLYASAEGFYHNVPNYDDVARLLRQQEGWVEDEKFPLG